MTRTAAVLLVLAALCFIGLSHQAPRWANVKLGSSNADAEFNALLTNSLDFDVRLRFESQLNQTAKFALLLVDDAAPIATGVNLMKEAHPEEDLFLLYPQENVAQHSGWQREMAVNAIRIVGEMAEAMLVAKPRNAPYPAVWPPASFLVARPVAESKLMVPAEFDNGSFDKAYNEVIAALVAKVSEDRLTETDKYLSDAFFSRLAYTTSNWTIAAQKWLVAEFEKLEGLTVTTQFFRSGYTDNVIAELKGTEEPETVVIIGAHYDSRGPRMDPSVRAPGADDNGSGSSAVLEVARVLVGAKVPFKYTIRFCLWSGEEQGLYGSTYYAARVREDVDKKLIKVVAYLNADMISYKVPTEPVQLGMDQDSTTKTLVAAVKEIAAQYVPTLAVGDATGCCTDTQGFYARGFSTAGFFERRGGIRNPYYHTSQDAYPASANSMEQVHAITQVFLASLATLAVPTA